MFFKGLPLCIQGILGMTGAVFFGMGVVWQYPGRSCWESEGTLSAQTEAERGPSTMLVVALGTPTPGPINIIRV